MNTTSWTGVLTIPVSAERDHVRGPLAAAATVVEYGDYECPYCAAANRVVEEIRARMSGTVCFAFRHFPLTTIHPRAQAAAEAAEAAGAQRRFWEMHDCLFANQQALDDEHISRFAQVLHLDRARFQRDLTSHAHLPKVREDFMSGVRSGVNGTPTFYINDARYDGSWELPSLLAAVQAAADGRAG